MRIRSGSKKQILIFLMFQICSILPCNISLIPYSFFFAVRGCISLTFFARTSTNVSIFNFLIKRPLFDIWRLTDICVFWRLSKIEQCYSMHKQPQNPKTFSLFTRSTYILDVYSSCNHPVIEVDFKRDFWRKNKCLICKKMSIPDQGEITWKKNFKSDLSQLKLFVFLQKFRLKLKSP